MNAVIGVGVERRVAVSDGLNIAYEMAGSGDPPVVFLHGVFGNRTYFAGQIQHLAPRHRVISADLRAHGESDIPPLASVEDFERDAIAVLVDAGGGPAVLCGHSMAGGVALSVAARRPELVRGVVLLDGVLFFPDAVREGALAGLLPGLNGPGWLDALRGYLGRLVAPAPPDVASRILADVSHARPEIARSFFDSLFGSAYGPRQERYAEDLRTIKCPLMYVHATAPADLARIRSLKPDAMIGQVVGSGHYLMLSAAGQLNAMLDRFLDLVVEQGS
jgi:pimeloyl-ACP methyl ester carboxylesterase